MKVRRVAVFLAEIGTFSTYVKTGNNLLIFIFDKWFISIYMLAEGHQLIGKMKRSKNSKKGGFENSNIIGPYYSL